MSAITLGFLWKDPHGVAIGSEEQVAMFIKFWFYDSSTVREKRSLPTDIWTRTLSSPDGKTHKIGRFER